MAHLKRPMMLVSFFMNDVIMMSLLLFKIRAIIVWPWKMVLVSVRYLFYQPMDEKIKTLIWRRHCLIGQSCCSVTSKRSIDWFLESSSGMKFFHPSVRLFDKPIKSLYFHLFVVSVLLARFRFKIIRKSLSQCVSQLHDFFRHKKKQKSNCGDKYKTWRMVGKCAY